MRKDWMVPKIRTIRKNIKEVHKNRHKVPTNYPLGQNVRWEKKFCVFVIRFIPALYLQNFRKNCFFSVRLLPLQNKNFRKKKLSEAHVKNFLFHRKVMFCSQDIKVFVLLPIPWFTRSVTSWWVLHETG